MSWILPFLLCLLFAVVSARIGIVIFNAVPAKWLCDYDEQPDAALYGKRLSIWPHGAVFALILFLSFYALSFPYSGTVFYACCIAAVFLLLIAVSDARYTIIPDEFVLALLVPILVIDGYDLIFETEQFHLNWLSPIWGALSGAGLMLLLSLCGKLVFRKEALGFGDVKLFGAAGLLAGFPHVFLLFFMTIFLALFYILFLLLRGKILKDLTLPLGPYICLALLLFLAFHRQIVGFAGWYLSLLSL